MTQAKPEMITMPAHSTNQWSREGQKIQYIVLHYVGAVSTAKNNGTYYGSTAGIGASAHFFVDEHDIVYSVPLGMSAGHCGVDYSGGTAPFWGKCRNKNSIGIEMCCKRRPNGDWYIEPETVTRTVGLVRWLMAEYGIDRDHVVRHYDVCRKICPWPWVNDTAQWTAFRNRLEEKEIVAKPWYEKTGEWAEASRLGITDGKRPDAPASRAEVAAMILRARRLEAMQ